MQQYIIKAIDTRSRTESITTGKLYITLEGIEKDISENIWKYPDYVTFIGDKGIPMSCHAARFEIIEEVPL